VLTPVIHIFIIRSYNGMPTLQKTNTVCLLAVTSEKTHKLQNKQKLSYQIHMKENKIPSSCYSLKLN